MEAGALNDAPPPALNRVADLVVTVGEPIEIGRVGHFVRRVVPIIGGRCRTRDWQARVLDAGADFQLIRDGRVSYLEARYVMETDAGDRIYVDNRAIRSGPPELIARIARGEPVDPALIYFRCTPRFETGAPTLAWLMERIFVGSGVRRPSEVALTVYEVR